ncbi:NAD-dependent succinate-semialdehyde dehydrogenase [Merismopedia glauca]|uniref:NADP-dependent succinic semialdehyde dehydrogenase n=1 Tax=Merismopedia glauca CCAP 1448/3 TaxID=1296344 RepID=A0A2T1C4E3_9CYAN|nr:NAD-dependent succinate-semialdehyde dehydrogenase [Merismopedia glauca]PSB03007.1 NADP-dependent succinic semialdehyde dehydrogenase [Merismopedia glauca CCAP 1448/3]
MAIATVNPATGETLKTFTPIADTELEAKLTQAEQAYQNYKRIPFSQRAEWMHKVADIVENQSPQFGEMMTTEMGKPLKMAILEAQKCATVCRYYADNAEEFLQDQEIKLEKGQHYVKYQPLGVILGVMPWNFPFWQVFRFAVPALMAGNVCLLKHASNVPQSALAIEEIFLQAGFPVGAFQTLLLEASKIEKLMADPRVKAASLTGSEAAGASLAAAAGKNLKKTLLELGGSDPFIVLESANLDAAVQTAVIGRMLNNGQSCIAAKRFIVQEAIASEFTNRLLDKYRALKIGDPMSPDTDLGPLATPKILEELDRQVQASIQGGAKLLIGGKPLSDRPGNYYPPTILTEIPVGTPADQEEFFGPVALLFTVKDIDEAIAKANDTAFGLGASAWTTNLDEQKRLIEEIESGVVFINSFVQSNPSLPFGGIKRSGYGRELGLPGILEFVNIKTVSIS